MKTSIKSLILSIATGILLCSTTANTFAADGKKETILSDVKKINKISVAGNVELILVQRADEGVKVYDDYYAKNALVQQKDGELRISSFNQETLTVVVYVNQLSALRASDNARVRTAGAFNAVALNVELQDKATAELNANTLELNASVSGIAKLTLNGRTENYNALMGSFATVNMDRYAAQSTSIQSRNTAVAKTTVVRAAELPDAE